MKVRFAVSPTMELCDGAVFPDVVDALESLGFDTIWLSDIPMGAQLDPIVGLALAAGRTTRLKLGANLVPLGRNPMLLAKELAQLDRLSGGRLLLSLVPGLDAPGERDALGVGEANRGRLLDEIIPLLRGWWSGAPVDHHSERFRFAGVTVRPTPQQDPLEIWLGGTGPQALRRAGRWSDGWLGAAVTPAEAGAAVQAIQVAADGRGTHDRPGALRAEHPVRAERAGPRVDRRTAGAPPRRRRGRHPPRRRGRPARTSSPASPTRGCPSSSSDRCGLERHWREELAWLADTVLPLQT